MQDTKGSKNAGNFSWRWAFLLVATGLAPVTTSLHGAYPLVVDDAGVVAPGETEVALYYAFESQPNEATHSFPIDITHGVHPRIDVALSGGYQFWEDREGDETERTDGWTDLIVASKFLLLEPGRLPFGFTLESSLKLPTFQPDRGVGTREVDLGLKGIATWEREFTALDVNLGYLFSEHFRGRRRDGDEWFFGAAVRHTATEKIELFGEGFFEGFIAGRSGTVFIARAGATWEICPGFLISGAVGTGFGTDSPDLLLTTGATWRF